MKRKLRIVIDCGDTFCAGCTRQRPTGMQGTPFVGAHCMLFDERLELAGESKPKRHAKCLEAEGMR